MAPKVKQQTNGLAVEELANRERDARHATVSSANMAVQFVITRPSGDSCTACVPPAATTRDLKAKLEEYFGVPRGEQRLLACMRELQAHEVLTQAVAEATPITLLRAVPDQVSLVEYVTKYVTKDRAAGDSPQASPEIMILGGAGRS